jgi:hypothetical protein
LTRAEARSAPRAETKREGVVRLEYGGVTVVDLERLRNYGA